MDPSLYSLDASGMDGVSGPFERDAKLPRQRHNCTILALEPWI
jgi:hypothetical protein